MKAKIDMKAKVDALAQEFKKHQPSLYTTKYEQMAKNKELMGLFASLNTLMQSPLFFEILFQEGFNKFGEHWHFISPIAPILNTYFAILHDSYLVNYTQWSTFSYLEEVDDFSSTLSPFYCGENKWWSTKAGIDTVTSQWLVSHQRKDEVFLGGAKAHIREGMHQKIIQQLQSSPSQKMTALLFLYNGTYVEPYFFIKTGKDITVIGSSSNYTHSEMVDIMEENNITFIKSPDVMLLHDGNCAVHSELNINSVLYEALKRNNSVYDALVALRKEDSSLKKYRVTFKDLKIHPGPKGPIPDDPTLARLLAVISRISLTLGSKGWVEFCKARGIHPKHALKTCIEDWHQFKDPIWHDGFFLPGYLGEPSTSEPPSKPSTPGPDEAISPNEEPSRNDTPFADKSLCIGRMKQASTQLRDLYNSIEELSRHAKTMGREEKGAQLEEHVDTLRNRLDDFLYESAQNGLTPEQEKQFKIEFTDLLHSKDPEMDHHRTIWKPIVANILISLTGIGFVALIVKMIAHILDSKKTHFSFNKAVFFGQTQSQSLAKEIEKTTENTPLFYNSQNECQNNF